jgi:hypothetical protein
MLTAGILWATLGSRNSAGLNSTAGCSAGVLEESVGLGGLQKHGCTQRAGERKSVNKGLGGSKPFIVPHKMQLMLCGGPGRQRGVGRPAGKHAQ